MATMMKCGHADYTLESNDGTQEIAYNQHIEHPDGPALRKAVELLEPLTEPEETTDSER